MLSKENLKIAVVGATGNVGRTMLNILEERGFLASQVHAVASSKSAGKKVSFGEDEILIVEDLENFDFSKANVALFSPGSKVSSEYAPKAADAGCIVIDNTSYFRTDEKIPLIVPEVNPESIKEYSNKNIIANPNCAIIPIVLALKPLHEEIAIKRIIVSTYQSVSGAGKEAMDELDMQTRSLFTGTPKPAEKLSRPIAYNLIPQIDVITNNGYTAEELKMRSELKKILDKNIELSATCVRVPVFIGHCSCVHVEFEEPFNTNEILKIWQKTKGLTICDIEDSMEYATPLDCVGKDEVLISRLRQDISNKNGIVFWTASDNLRKGAALNAVQILELLIDSKLQ